jgi:hypothetical protein
MKIRMKRKCVLEPFKVDIDDMEQIIYCDTYDRSETYGYPFEILGKELLCYKTKKGNYVIVSADMNNGIEVANEHCYEVEERLPESLFKL